jgi:predicted lipid-binding transport protein (Tim44 family)
VPADIILYALIAAGLVFWLRSVLGTRNSDERQRPNPFSQQSSAADNGKSTPVLPVADKKGLTAAEDLIGGPLTLPRNSNITLGSPSLEPALLNIARLDRNFSLAHFGTVAQDVFVMIVEAFAHGDRDLLKILLAPDLYKAFDQALTERAEAGHVMTAEIHAIRKVEISDAQLKDKMTYITVRFVADETVITRDKDGAVVSGNPDRVRETIDIWTFGRNATSKDPTWFLHATREEDVSEIPSAGTMPPAS